MKFTKMKTFFGAAVLAASLALPGMAQAQALTEDQIKQLVYDAIRENPEIIMEAVAILQQRDAEAQETAVQNVLNDQRNILENDPNAPVLGNPDGDVTIVEFFDYNCPFCKRSAPVLKALLEADPGIRLVYREWPILSEGSLFAAQAALAARKQGKYEEFHWALMELKGPAEETSVMRIAGNLGLDLDQLRQDMQAEDVQEHIATTSGLTTALGFNGTPSFVIGDELVPGFVEQAALESLVEQARNAE